MKKLLLLICILSLMFIPVFSQEEQTDDVDDFSLEDLLNVEVTSVSKNAENILEAPASIIAISAEEIKQRGYIDLEQIFHDLPGFDISRGNGTLYSQIYQRGYRSNNTDRTLLLVDGVEENDLWKGTVWLSRQYPISNIKRVEVIYGPSSTMYGANAFVGVINIVTKDSEDILKKDKAFGINAQVNYGSWNTMYTDLTMAVKKGDFSFTLTGRVYKSDEMDLSGFPDWDYNLDSYDTKYYKEKLGTSSDLLANQARNLDMQQYYAINAENGNKVAQYSNNTDDYFFAGKMKIDNFVFGFQTWRRDEGYGSWYRDDYESGPANDGKWVAANTFFYAKYEKQLSDKVSIMSFTRYKTHQLDGDSQENYYVGYLNGEYGLGDLTDAGGSAQPYWYTAWWYVLSKQLRTELKLIYTPNDKLSLITGLEYRDSHIQGTYVKSGSEVPEETGFPRDKAGTGLPGGNHYNNRDIGFYAQAKYKPSKELNLLIGGRVDNNKIRATGGFGTVFNPRLAVVYTPGKLILKAIYSTAFKDADNWTKYSTTSGRLLTNPTLEPESVKNMELSFSYRATKNLFLDLSAYNANYSDVVGTANITLDDGSTTTQHQAMGSLRIRGVQAGAKYVYKNYSAYMNYTFVDPQNTDDDIRIGDIATHQINLGVNAKFLKKLNINIRMNYVGERETGANTTISSNPYDSIDSYIIFHSAITYKDLLPGISLQLVVNNLFDSQYFHPGVRSAGGDYYAARMPQNERSFMLKAIFEL